MGYDYVIVGAGSAGCVLAHRLSEDPQTRVCLLEAGPRDRSPLIRIPFGIVGLMRSRRLNWAYWSEPQPRLHGRRLFWPRGRTLGGSSAINAMCYTRGHPADYQAWAAAGNPGWGWSDLLPYFRRSERNSRGADRYHGDGGPLWVSDPLQPNPLSLAFVEAAVAAGHRRNEDFNGACQEGVGLYQLMQERGRRCSNAYAYLRPALSRPNLTVITGAHVGAIRLAGGRAIGVDYRRGAVAAHARAEAEVLLAAGAVNSPQILQLSGVGPADELRRHGLAVAVDLPGVGGNLQDHLDIAVSCAASSRVGISLAPAYYGRGLRAGMNYLLGRPGEWNSNAAEAGGFSRSGPQAPRPDLQFHFLPVIEEQHGLDLSATARGFGYTLRVCDLQPQSRGRIRLGSADPSAAPLIDPNYLAAPRDLSRLLAGLKQAREILAAAPFAQHRRRERRPGAELGDDQALTEYIRAHAETIYHPVGTCAMGKGPQAVVDAELRVHGVEGLRVVDASIMPSQISGNTNAAVTAIAERAADLIRGHRPLPPDCEDSIHG